MIKSKEDLKRYLAMDKYALGITKHRPGFFDEADDIWRFEIILRKHEYYRNCTKNTLMRYFYAYLHYKMGYKLGFNIPVNLFEGGLHILHAGTITVNNKARIGQWCTIAPNVAIGQSSAGDAVPVIDNHIYIGIGAKVIGKIVIGDNTMIGANAVVCKSFPQGNVTLAGNPAKIISKKGNVFHIDEDLFEKEFQLQ